MTLEDDFVDELDLDYPEIEIETDELKLIITLKKDYSKEENIKLRKKEFFNDLESFIEEFRETPESNDLMLYYDLENFEKSLKDNDDNKN